MLQKPIIYLGRRSRSFKRSLSGHDCVKCVKFCHLQHEKTGSIALPQQVVILPSYPNSTLVPVVFLDFSSFREPANTTLRLVFTVRGSLALMWRKIKETLWDQGTLTVSEQIRCSSCSNGLQCLMADKPSGWNRQ